MTDNLLSGYRFIEIGHPLTEYAGQILAGLGAEVLLIEPPEGALTRHRNPRVPESGESSRGSIPFLARNTNKRSLMLDPENIEDMATLTALSARANCVLSVAGSPFHRAVVDATIPALVTVTDERNLGISSIVGFAASGGLASTGWQDRPPCNAPSWFAHDGTGIYVAVLAMIAEVARRRGETCIRFEVPYEEAAIASITPWTRPLHSYGTSINGQGFETARRGVEFCPTYQVRDGYVRILTATPGQWQSLVTLLGDPDDLVNGPLSVGRYRSENLAEMIDTLARYLADQSMNELFHHGQKLGLTVSPVNTLNQFIDDPHTRERSFIKNVTDPEFGEISLLRPPLLFAPDELNNESLTPAPALGNANADLANLLTSQPSTTAGKTPPFEKNGFDNNTFDLACPLKGLRVLEIGLGQAIPEAAALLAAFGAEVIKLESEAHLDFTRGELVDKNNRASFNQLNLGVKSLAVNMREADGVALVRQLAMRSDVIMDNMRRSVTASWKLDFPSVREFKKDIVYLGSQGYGNGPYRDYISYGPNLMSFSGAASQWAHPDDPLPIGSPLNQPDPVVGKQALVAILAGLLRREQDGEGMYIEAAQVETAGYYISDRIVQASVFGQSPLPLGNRSLDMSPHGCYPCAGDDVWVTLAVENDDEWLRLKQVVGADWMSDNALDNTKGRLARADEIDAGLSDWTRRLSVDDVEGLLRNAGISVCRVRTGDDLAADEPLANAGFFPVISHPVAGHHHYTGLPFTLEGHGRYVTRRSPLLGEHTEDILYDVLGVDATEVNRLMSAKIVGY